MLIFLNSLCRSLMPIVQMLEIRSEVFGTALDCSPVCRVCTLAPRDSRAFGPCNQWCDAEATLALTPGSASANWGNRPAEKWLRLGPGGQRAATSSPSTFLHDRSSDSQELSYRLFCRCLSLRRCPSRDHRSVAAAPWLLRHPLRDPVSTRVCCCRIRTSLLKKDTKVYPRASVVHILAVCCLFVEDRDEPIHQRWLACCFGRPWSSRC